MLIQRPSRRSSQAAGSGPSLQRVKWLRVSLASIQPAQRLSVMVAPMLARVTRGDGAMVRNVSSLVDLAGEKGTIPTDKVGYKCRKSPREAREA
jgi:hypothetical protein